MVHTTGATNHLDYGNVTEMNGASAMTWMWWWVPGTFTSDGGGVMGKNTGNPFRWIMSSTAGHLRIQANTGDIRNANADFTAGTLTHVACVFDGSLAAASRLVIYQNGTSLALTISANMAATLGAGDTSVFRVGQEIQNNTDINNDFGHLKIWNAALSSDEIKREMLAYVPRRTNNLILWCPYDDDTQFGNYANTAYVPTQTGAVTQTTGGEPTLHGAELDPGQLILPQRFGRRTQRPRWGDFRSFGKLVPRYQDPM